MLILWKGFILSHVLEASRFYRHSKSRDMMPKVPGLTRLILLRCRKILALLILLYSLQTVGALRRRVNS
jgi:hypothetical protein